MAENERRPPLFLKQRYLLTETEILHLKSGSLRPQKQVVRMVEFLMNKGSYSIGALDLCLIESSEQLSGLSAHYQLAGDQTDRLVLRFNSREHWIVNG